MGVVIKQSFWSTILAYAGVLIGYLNTLYLRPQYFQMDQIGLFGLITANAMMISPFSTFGMSSSYLKFFPSFEEKDRNKFLSFQFLIVSTGVLVTLIIGYFLRNLIAARYVETAPEYINYLLVTGIIIVVNSLFDLFYSYSRTVMKVLTPTFLRDIFLRVAAIFLVVGYALNWFSFEWAVRGLAINYSLALLFLYGSLAFNGFRFDFSFGFIPKEIKKSLFKFATYSMFLAGSYAVMNNVTYDQVTTYLGTTANGIFITCFFIGTIVEMPRRNMAKVISPILSEEFQKNNFEEIRSLYKRSSITMTVMGGLLFIGIVTNLNDLFLFIPKGDEFSTGFLVAIMVCLAKLSVMTTSFPGEIINYSPYYRFNLLFQIGIAILLVILNYYLIPIYGLNGAGISYLIAINVHNLFKVSLVYQKFKIHPFLRSHLTLLIISTLVGTLAWFWNPGLHPVINIGIRSIATGIAYIFLIYQFKISNDINKLIGSTFERFLHIKLSK